MRDCDYQSYDKQEDKAHLSFYEAVIVVKVILDKIEDASKVQKNIEYIVEEAYKHSCTTQLVGIWEI